MFIFSIRKSSPGISGKVYHLKGKKETRRRQSSDGWWE